MWASFEAQQKGGLFMRRILFVLAVVMCMMGVLVGCSKESFDGKYNGKQTTNDGYEKYTEADVVVEDNYMTVKLTITDEYSDDGDYNTDEAAGDCKVNKSGNALSFKSGGRIYELRKLQSKYHLLIKTKYGDVKNDIVLKKK